MVRLEASAGKKPRISADTCRQSRAQYHGASGRSSGKSLHVACKRVDDLVDHICASHLAQCRDVLDDLMRDYRIQSPFKLVDLVLLYF